MFEFTHDSIHDPLKKKCPECGKYELYQDLTGQHTFIYQEPKTLGHLAERNTERAGKYELEKARSEMRQKPEPNKTWYNKEGKNLAKELSGLNTPEKKKKYIFTGEK
jgi:hypothetical protein